MSRAGQGVNRRPETGPRGTALGWALIHLVPTLYAVIQIASNR